MQKTDNFDASDLLLFVYKHRKLLAVITLLAALSSLLVSLLITPKFQSSVILFPASSSSVSKALLTDMSRAPKDILKFGDEEEAEQMLQVLHSDEIRDKIIAKYQLMAHYEIELSSAYPYTKLAKEYKENVNFRRTEFMSVVIEVLDKDPKMAADIANNIAALLDSTINRMQKQRALKALQLVENELLKVKNEIKTHEDSLLKLRQKGIYDYATQTAVFNKAYAEAILKGENKKAGLFEEKLQNLARYGGAYITVNELLAAETKQLNFLKNKHAEAALDARQNLPHKYIVNSAKVSEKKAYPKRSYIVLLSTFAAFILALLSLLFFQKIKQLSLE